MSQDPQFRTVSAPDDYSRTTASPVRYVPVTRQGRTLGYVWASTIDDAAGYIWRPDELPDSFNTGQHWLHRLRWAKANGLPPLAVLRHWAGAPEDEHGYVAAEAEQEASSLQALKALAGEG